MSCSRLARATCSPWRWSSSAWIALDRMLAIEQCEDLDQIDRQHDDLGDVASRIAQRDVPLAFLLDRKCLDRPEPRRVAHGFRKLRADAT